MKNRKINNQELNKEIPFEKLKNEIEEQNKSRTLEAIKMQSDNDNKNNVENFKKNQKPKKSLKKRIIAWALGVGIFAGASIGAYFGTKSNEFEKSTNILNTKLTQDVGTYLKDIDIKTIKFEEPSEKDVMLVVSFDAYIDAETKMQFQAFYNVLIEYYNNLVKAEKSGLTYNYLHAINEVFKNMNFKDSSCDFLIKSFKFDGFIAKNGATLNAIIGLDKRFDGVYEQVAFLPYRIELLEDSRNKQNYTQTFKYKISGISYCSVKEKHFDELKQSDELITRFHHNPLDITAYNIKAYYREFELTLTEPNEKCIAYIVQLPDFMKRYVNNEIDSRSKMKIETTYFDDVKMFGVMNKYYDMALDK